MPKPLVSLGQLIDRSWELYRRHWADFLSVSGLLLTVALLNVVALSLYPFASQLFSSAPLTASQAVGVVLFWAANSLLAPALGLYTLLAMARIANARLAGKALGAKESLRDSRKLFWPAVLVSLLVALYFAAALLVGMVPALLSYLLALAITHPLVSLLGALLSLAGVLAAGALTARWAVDFAFALYALACDGARGREALRASREAVRGRFWGVLLRLVVPSLVFIAVGVLFAVVLSVVAGLAVSAAAGLNLDVYLRLVSITDSVFPALAAVLINPLVVIATVILYRDLKGEA